MWCVKILFHIRFSKIFFYMLTLKSHIAVTEIIHSPYVTRPILRSKCSIKFSIFFFSFPLQFVKIQCETREMWIIQSVPLTLLRDIFLQCRNCIETSHEQVCSWSLVTTPHKSTVVKAILQNYVHSHLVKESSTIPLTKHNQETSEG